MDVVLSRKRLSSGRDECDELQAPAKRAHVYALKCVAEDGGAVAMECNGTAGRDVLGNRKWINRREYIRLLEQALYNLGYVNLAKQLEEESGVQCQSAEVTRLQSAVLNGDWDIACSVLDQLKFRSGDDRTQAKFLVLEQKYLEALERKDWLGAVRVLRHELSPLQFNAKRLQRLASCILCSSSSELEARAVWTATSRGSRQQLLVSLQNIVPPDEMLPSNRLEALIEQAIDSQLMKCRYYNTHQVAVTLLSDYKCGPEQIPTATTQELTDHGDEVWHVQFSHNGRYLATASRDCSAIIWLVEGRLKVHKKLVLLGHTQPITFVAWSPDDKLLATCGSDCSLRIWDVGTGACVHNIKQHAEQVTCMAWMPDGKAIISGSSDKHMVMCDLAGHLLRSWPRRRVHDMAVTSDGKRVLTTSSDEKICISNLEDGSEEFIAEKDSILSLALSADDNHLLVHLKNQSIHLWQLPRQGHPMPSAPVQHYRGLQQRSGRFVVRSCFGGFKQAFVLSGSEESKVYVWHRDSGELVAELTNHSGTVNAVAWNPVQHHIFASASDDKTVNIWSVSDEVAAAAGLP